MITSVNELHEIVLRDGSIEFPETVANPLTDIEAALFEPQTWKLLSGGNMGVSSALIAASMESDSCGNEVFIPQGISRMGVEDIVKETYRYLDPSSGNLSNFDYGPSDSVQLGHGFPSALAFQRAFQAALGGWGVFYVEATVPEMGFAARNHGFALNDDTLDHHINMVDVFKAYRLFDEQRIMLQITHAGWSAKTPLNFRNMLPPEGGDRLNPPTDGQLGHVLNSIQSAGFLAADAGYDGIDIKLCHGYGLPDFLLNLVRGAESFKEVQERIRPFLDVFTQVRDYATDTLGKPNFAIGFRFSYFEGVPNGWGAKFDPDFDGRIGKYGPQDINKLWSQRDTRLSLWTIQALSLVADYIHSSLGIPGCTPEEVRGTRRINPYSFLHHTTAVSEIHYALTEPADDESARDIPIIVSNMTGAGAGALAYLHGNIRGGRKPSLGSYGRGFIADPLMPLKHYTGNPADIAPCMTCSGCSKLLIDPTTPSGCSVYDPTIKAIKKAK